MGLDLLAGLVVLFGAIRGYFRGFFIPLAKLGSLIGAVYLADPLRIRANPYVQPYFPAIDAETYARLSWWAALLVGYLATASISCGLLRLTVERKDPERRGAGADRFLGFLLGGIKGAATVALLLTAVLWKESLIAQAPGGEKLLAGSRTVAWTRAHDPFGKLWVWPPFVHLRTEVYENGWFPPKAAEEGSSTESVARGDDEAPAEEADLPKIDPIRSAEEAGEALKAIREIRERY